MAITVEPTDAPTGGNPLADAGSVGDGSGAPTSTTPVGAPTEGGSGGKSASQLLEDRRADAFLNVNNPTTGSLNAESQLLLDVTIDRSKLQEGFSPIELGGLSGGDFQLGNRAVNARTSDMNIFGALIGFRNMSPTRKAWLQEQMFDAGFLPEPVGEFGDPYFGDEDFKVWGDLLTTAHRMGQEVFSLLDDYARSGREFRARGSGGAGRKRPTVQIIGREDAGEIIQSIAKQEMGRKLTKSESRIVDAITDVIRQQQTTEQNAIINQQMAGGGVVDSPTSVQTIAKGQVEENFATETGARNVAESFVNLIRSAGAGG